MRPDFLVGLLLTAGCLAAPGDPTGRPAGPSTAELRTRAAADSIKHHLAPLYSDAMLAVDSAAAVTSCQDRTFWYGVATQALTVAFAERTEEVQLLRWALRDADSTRARR